jgi:hypothetical protein
MKKLDYFFKALNRFLFGFIKLHEYGHYIWEIEVLPIHVSDRFSLLSMGFKKWGEQLKQASEVCGFEIFLVQNKESYKKLDLMVHKGGPNGVLVDYLGSIEMDKTYDLSIDYEIEETEYEAKTKCFNYTITLCPSTHHNPVSITGFAMSDNKFGYLYKQ